MRKIQKYFQQAIHQFPKEFLMTLWMSLFYSLSNLLMIILFRFILEYVQHQFQFRFLLFGILSLLILMGISIWLNIHWAMALDRFGGKYITHILKQAQTKLNQISKEQLEFAHIEHLDHILFGDILDVFRVIGHMIPSILSSLIFIFILLVFSMMIDGFISLYLLLVVFLGIGISLYAKKQIVQASSNTNLKIKEYHAALVEYTNKIDYIQSNHLFDYYTQITEDHIQQFITSSIHEDRKIYFFSNLVNQYNALSKFILSILLALPLYQNALTNLAFYVVLFTFLMAEGEKIELLYQQITRSKICFDHLEDIFSIPTFHQPISIPHIHSIVFDDVSFQYPNGRKVLDHFSLTCTLGDLIRLDGKNGAGKSTIFKLLLKQYEPTHGTIYINQIPLSQIDPDTYFHCIAYISQHEPLIQTTLTQYLKNISHQDLDEQTIQTLLQDLHIEHINNICETNISGGEHKKLLLAKLALLQKTADVICIDEIDAEFDQQTQKYYMDMLAQMAQKQNKIILFIQHHSINTIPHQKTIHIDHSL